MEIQEWTNSDNAVVAATTSSWDSRLQYDIQIWNTPTQKPASLPLQEITHSESLEAIPSSFVRMPVISKPVSQQKLSSYKGFGISRSNRKSSGVQWMKSPLSNSNGTSHSVKASTPAKRSSRTSRSSKKHFSGDLGGKNVVPVKLYQKLLTDYKTAQRTIKNLLLETQGQQRKAAILHSSRLQEAVEIGASGSRSQDADGGNKEISGIANEEQDPSSSCPNFDVIISKVICSEALRPVAFQINAESPPDMMRTVIERLATSKNRCESCGKKFQGVIEKVQQQGD